MQHLGRLIIAIAFLSALAPAAQALQPCCAIQAVDARTGVVTANDRTTGQNFQFQVSPAQAQGLRPGQAVYGSAASGRVGLDPSAPCCPVVSRGGGAAAARTAAAPVGPCCGIQAVDARTADGACNERHADVARIGCGADADHRSSGPRRGAGAALVERPPLS